MGRPGPGKDDSDAIIRLRRDGRRSNNSQNFGRQPMRPSDGQPVRLSEYRAPDYFIEHVELDVSLDIHATRVVSSLTMRPNPAGRTGAALALDGDELMFVSARLDGDPLEAASFEAKPSGF